MAAFYKMRKCVVDMDVDGVGWDVMDIPGLCGCLFSHSMAF